jgi:hypothetical protein
MKNRRTKLTVDSTVQWALVRRVLRHWAMFLVMIVLLLPVWYALISLDIIGTSNSFLEAVIAGMGRSAPLLVFFAAIAPIIVYDILKLSNRFSGPVYRLHKGIKALTAGEEVLPIQLRKDDYWQHVIEDFNALAEQVASMRKRESSAANANPAVRTVEKAEEHLESALS